MNQSLIVAFGDNTEYELPRIWNMFMEFLQSREFEYFLEQNGIAHIFDNETLPFVSRIYFDMIKHPDFCSQLRLAIFSYGNKEKLEPFLRMMPSFFGEHTRNDLFIISRIIFNFFGRQRLDNMLREIDLPKVLGYSFGTEECLRLRRELVALYDTITNIDKSVSSHSSGSLSEGVAYPLSDYDIMIVHKEEGIADLFENVKDNINFIMVHSESSPGYCLVVDIKRSTPQNLAADIDGFRCLSSTLYKEFKRRDPFFGNDSTIHGPCLNLSSGCVDYDFAMCIKCPVWPYVAREWFERVRSYGWPSEKQIEHIVGNGCHVVPIGDPDSPNGDHEWRISFSLAERNLVHSFNHSQFLTYNALRNALKNVIDKQFPDVLCSYFIKTTMFHTIERTPREMWCIDNLEICYSVSLYVLYLFVESANCPNYFIPRYNMMKRKINDANRQPLLELIAHLYHIRILGFDYLRYFDVKPLKRLELIHDYEFFTSFLLNHTKLNLRQLCWSSFCNKCISNMSATNILLSLLIKTKTEDKFIDIILIEGFSYLSQKFIDILARMKKRNKEMYTHHKTLKAYLQISKRGHSTTNMLTKATYLYFVGNTRKSISVLQDHLHHSRQCAAFLRSGYKDAETYMESVCNKGYTIEQKARIACTDNYTIHSIDLHAFPSSLSIWLITCDIVDFHPVTYGCFLECLCHLQSKNAKSLIKSMNNMMDHLKNLTNETEKIDAFMCMGIIHFSAFDNQKAYQWFTLVYQWLQKLNNKCKSIIAKNMQTTTCENTQIKTKKQRKLIDSIYKFSKAVVLYVACLIHREINLSPNFQSIIAPTKEIQLD